VPTTAKLMAYYSVPSAVHFLNLIPMMLANISQLSHICPIPLAWAVYFMDSKSPPYSAFQTGLQLIATLDTADKQDRHCQWLAGSKWLV
jgi:hypothetical protein